MYTSTSDVMTHENFHKKNTQLINDGFQRFRATEDCGTADCQFYGQKTTHFHCRCRPGGRAGPGEGREAGPQAPGAAGVLTGTAERAAQRPRLLSSRAGGEQGGASSSSRPPLHPVTS